MRGGVALPTGGWGGLLKNNFSLEMACFGAFWAVFFVRVLARKMLIFGLKDVEDVLLENSENSVRVMGVDKLFTALNARNLVLEILKHGEIWRDNLHHRPPHSKFWGTRPPRPP